MRGFLLFLTALVLGAAIALGAAYFFLVQPPATQITGTPIPTSAAAVSSFDGKVATFAGGSRTMSVTVALTDAELTSKMSQVVQAEQAAYGADVQNLQVSTRDGKVYVSGKVKTNDLPFRVDLVVVIVPEVRNGRLHLRVERVEAGRIPLPDALKQRLVGTIENDSYVNDTLPISVERVEVQTGQLLLTGRPK